MLESTSAVPDDSQRPWFDLVCLHAYFTVRALGTEKVINLVGSQLCFHVKPLSFNICTLSTTENFTLHIQRKNQELFVYHLPKSSRPTSPRP